MADKTSGRRLSGAVRWQSGKDVNDAQGGHADQGRSQPKAHGGALAGLHTNHQNPSADQQQNRYQESSSADKPLENISDAIAHGSAYPEPERGSQDERQGKQAQGGTVTISANLAELEFLLIPTAINHFGWGIGIV